MLRLTKRQLSRLIAETIRRKMDPELAQAYDSTRSVFHRPESIDDEIGTELTSDTAERFHRYEEESFAEDEEDVIEPIIADPAEFEQPQREKNIFRRGYDSLRNRYLREENLQKLSRNDLRLIMAQESDQIFGAIKK